MIGTYWVIREFLICSLYYVKAFLSVIFLNKTLI